MKVLIVCLVLIGVVLSAPPPKKVEKGYELKEYHSSSKDNGYHGDSYGPKPHYDEGYGKKDYKKVEVKKYGYEEERDGYGSGYDTPRGYGDDNDKGYYKGYERTEYHDDKDDYSRPHGYSYDNKDTHAVQEKLYYGKYDSNRDNYYNRDGYGYGGDYAYGKDNSYGEGRSYGNKRGSYGYNGEDSYNGGEGYGYPHGDSYGRYSHGGGYGQFQGY